MQTGAYFGLNQPIAKQNFTPNIGEWSISEPCWIFNIILFGVFGMVISLIGISGNILSATVLWKIGHESVIFFLLFILSVCDLLHLLGYFMNYVFTEYLMFFGWYLDIFFTWYQYLYFYVLFPVYSVSVGLNMWMVCLITIQR